MHYKYQVGLNIMFDFRVCYRAIDQVGRVFVYGPGDRGSIPDRVIPNTQKMVLETSLLNAQYVLKYELKVKWINQGKGVAPSPTPRCK